MRNALKHNGILLLLLPTLVIGLGLLFASMLNVAGRRGRAGITGCGAFRYIRLSIFPQVLTIVQAGLTAGHPK